MALIPQKYVDSVVALGRPTDQGAIDWCASGFLYGHVLGPGPAEGTTNVRPYCVTCKHVVEGLTSISVLLNTATGDSKQVTTAFGAGWPQRHDAADLAAFPLPPQLLSPEEWGQRIFLSGPDVVTAELAADLGLTDGDSCFLLGYFPVWLIKDGQRSYPVVRHGTIARIRDYLSGHSDRILIDAMNFPGNSGGPVVVKPEFMAIQGTKSPGRSALLGVISAYIQYDEIAYSLVRLPPEPRVVFRQNSGLAEIVPAAVLAAWVASFPENRGEVIAGFVETTGKTPATDSE
jgi:hypothetical protein